MPILTIGTNYNAFMNAVNAANRPINNYDAFTASDASKLAGMEFRVKTYMSLKQINADQAYVELSNMLTTRQPNPNLNSFLSNDATNQKLLKEAVDNIKNNNTLIDPVELDKGVKNFLQTEQTEHEKYQAATLKADKNQHQNIHDDPTRLLSSSLDQAESVEDNFFLAIASRGNPEHHRTFGEWAGSRNDQNINLPYIEKLTSADYELKR